MRGRRQFKRPVLIAAAPGVVVRDLTMTLPSGRLIWLESFSSYRTYGGLIEGSPNREMNEWKILWNLKKLADDGREPYLIAPATVEGTLPEYTCHALISSKALDPRNDGAEAMFLWFSTTDEMLERLDKHILRMVGDIPWELVAKDWQL